MFNDGTGRILESLLRATAAAIMLQDHPSAGTGVH